MSLIADESQDEFPNGDNLVTINSAKIAPAALSTAAIGQLILINILWGGSSAAAKFALNDFGPFTLAFLRFLPAGLILYAVAACTDKRPDYKKNDWREFFSLGFLAITLSYTFFYLGANRTTSSDFSLVFACEPLMLALFARFFLKERLRPLQWTGMLIGLFGIWIIAGQQIGNLIALIGVVIESSTGIIAKRLSRRYSGLEIGAVEMIVGGLCLLPFAVVESMHHFPTFSISGLLSLLYLCLICSAFCVGTWFQLMTKYPISTIGAFILLQPLCGPFYGWLLRGEKLSMGSAMGGGLVITGLILTIWKFSQLKHSSSHSI